MNPELFASFCAATDPKRRALLAGQLLEENTPLVVLLTAQLCGWQEAKRSHRRVLPEVPGSRFLTREQALQCGRIGFARAIQGFDPKKGKLPYYCALWIRKTLCAEVGQLTKGQRDEELNDEGTHDESSRLHALSEMGDRIARLRRRLTREESRILDAVIGDEYEIRKAAKSLSMTTAHVAAVWDRLRAWMQMPDFAEEGDSVKRFLLGECIRVASARATSSELRQAYAATVSWPVSRRRFGMLVRTIGLPMGIRPAMLRVTHGDRARGHLDRAKGWVGVRPKARRVTA